MGSCISQTKVTSGQNSLASSECRVSLSANTTAKGKILRPKGGIVAVNSFLGIPYAQPPVGNLRFCPPKSVELWTGERDCTNHGKICPQPAEISKMIHEWIPDFPDDMSEDCLFLNVYSPNLNPDAGLPVMVYIHGGAFCVGASDILIGSPLSSFHNVVVVTINYRLGVLGFFTTGDGLIPGNLGLLDQVEALKWIQKNISAFGGNPANVTIFGESAGAMSCSLHMLSDMSEGLFKRAIIQSGPAISPWTMTDAETMRGHIQPFLDNFGYQGKTNEDLVAFLRSRSAEDLGSMAESLEMKVVVDGVFLKEHPKNLYSAGKFQKKEIIAGCCSHEGYTQAKMMITPDTPTDKESLYEHMKAGVAMFYPDGPESEKVKLITDRLVQLYVTDEAVGNVNVFKQQYTDAFGDLPFNGPNQTMALMHIDSAPTYVFNYAHRMPGSEDDIWVKADHAMDVIMVAGMPFTGLNAPLSETDENVSKTMMSYWANFAKTGNPNSAGLPEWWAFNKDNKPYMILNETPEMALNYRPDKMDFFEKELPKL